MPTILLFFQCMTEKQSMLPAYRSLLQYTKFTQKTNSNSNKNNDYSYCHVTYEYCHCQAEPFKKFGLLLIL